MRKLKIDDKYTLIHYDKLSEVLDYSRIEKKFNAKYIGEFSLKNKDFWSDYPVAIFYTEKKHPEGSNYFGILFLNHFLPEEKPSVFITNGISAAEATWTGVMNEKGEILYSGYRHDYQVYGDLMIDGGQDYVRSSLHTLVEFKIVKDHIEIIRMLNVE